MGKKRHTPEEIITKIREADVLQSKGQSVGEACRQIGVSEQTYYNWRKEIVRLASHHGRYGYRRITGLLHNEGWKVNHKCVERLWRLEGLKIPQKQPKRKRLWFNDRSCIRKRPLYRNHVWSYDFVADRTNNGRPLRMLTIIEEYTRESLAIKVDRALKAYDVIEELAELFVVRGTPEYIRFRQRF